jgi:hypothetical protein
MIINPHKKISLLIFIGLSLAVLAKREVIAESFSRIQYRIPLVLAQDWRVCQRIGKDVEEVYALETQNYYINICRQKENFLYHRQSKLDPEWSLLLPAEKVFSGSVFQAIYGKITYFVGLNSNGYYSSVMDDNNQIIFEPVLSSKSQLDTSVSNPNPSTPANNNSEFKLENIVIDH